MLDFLKNAFRLGENGEKRSFSNFFRLPKPLETSLSSLEKGEQDEVLNEAHEIAEGAYQERKNYAETMLLGLLDNEDSISKKIMDKLNFDSWFWRSKWMRSNVGLTILKFIPGVNRAYGFFSEDNFNQSMPMIRALAEKASKGDSAYEAKLLDSAADLRLICSYMEGRDIDWKKVIDEDDNYDFSYAEADLDQEKDPNSPHYVVKKEKDLDIKNIG